MTKIIATDMDHTLLNDESLLPENFTQVLDALEQQGIEFVCASGRSLPSLHKKVFQDKYRISFVSDNGASVEYRGTIIYKDTINTNSWHQMVLSGRQCQESSTVLTTVDGAYIEVHNEDHFEMLKEYYPEFHVVDDLTVLDLEVIKVTYLSKLHTLENFETHISPSFDKDFNAVRSGNVWIDIMNKGVNKGNGLKKLLKEFNLSSNDLMSFGDFHNDIEMLQLAGQSFAVSNAHQDVKDIAKEVIGSNNENSVLKTIIERVIAK